MGFPHAAGMIIFEAVILSFPSLHDIRIFDSLGPRGRKLSFNFSHSIDHRNNFFRISFLDLLYDLRMRFICREKTLEYSNYAELYEEDTPYQERRLALEDSAPRLIIYK